MQADRRRCCLKSNRKIFRKAEAEKNSY